MDIPEKNLFMMCRALNRAALRALPEGIHVRPLRPDELPLWKAIHFDDPETASSHAGFMDDYYDAVYAPRGDLFFKRCLVACDGADRPVGTCFTWQAYRKVTTLHWVKVIRACEGRGIGRALLSRVMEDVDSALYPVYLHTQPSSYRAIKLYTDFGFALLTDPIIGSRTNDLAGCLSQIKALMHVSAFERLKTEPAPRAFLDAVSPLVPAEF